MSLSHSIAKCGSTILSAAGRLSQIWNSSSRVGTVAVEQREHLAVHDAGAGGHPLHVAAAEAGGGAQRVAVVDQALPHVGDRLEAAVRVGREAGHDLAVVHAPAVDALEVLTELAAGERRRRAELGVARRVAIDVVHAEQERVGRRPLEPERHGLQHSAHERQAKADVRDGSARTERTGRFDVDARPASADLSSSHAAARCSATACCAPRTRACSPAPPRYLRRSAVRRPLHAVFVRSDVAHGTITSIDTGEAVAMPGVVAVWTADDLDVAPHHGFAKIHDDFARPPLATDRVRFVGEPVAVVFAESLAAGGRRRSRRVRRHRAAAVRSSMPRPRSATVRRVLFADRGNNVAVAESPDAALDLEAISDVVVRGRYVNQRVAVASMEPHCFAAAPGPRRTAHRVGVEPVPALRARAARRCARHRRRPSST